MCVFTSLLQVGDTINPKSCVTTICAYTKSYFINIAAVAESSHLLQTCKGADTQIHPHHLYLMVRGRFWTRLFLIFVDISTFMGNCKVYVEKMEM